LPPPFFFQTASLSGNYRLHPLYAVPFSGSLPTVSQPGWWCRRISGGGCGAFAVWPQRPSECSDGLNRTGNL